MQIYDFTFIVDTPPMEDDFEDRFFEAGCDDATLVVRYGAVALSFDREAESYKDAVLSAFSNIRSTGVNILRFEPDYLVNAADIAARTGLKRATISNYVKGDRLKGNFPRPCARFGAKSPLWDWVQVSHWLYFHKRTTEAEVRHAEISRVVNYCAQSRDSCQIEQVSIELERVLALPLEAA